MMERLRAASIAAAFGLALGAAGPAAAQDAPSARELDERVRRLENIVDSGQIAELIRKIDDLESEIRELRGDIEEQGHRLDEIRKRQRNLYGDLDRRLRELEVAGTTGTGEAAGTVIGAEGDVEARAGEAETGEGAAEGEPGAAGAGEGEPGAAGEGEQVAKAEQTEAQKRAAEREAYDAAFELLKQGRYGESAKAFKEFLVDHPDGPYADNAQYWLGESRYVTRDFEQALKAFRGVLDQFPDSAKVPDARLKIGYSLYELGRMDEARSALKMVMTEHPNSAVARLAEERLLKIKQEQQ